MNFNWSHGPLWPTSFSIWTKPSPKNRYELILRVKPTDDAPTFFWPQRYGYWHARACHVAEKRSISCASKGLIGRAGCHQPVALPPDSQADHLPVSIRRALAVGLVRS